MACQNARTIFDYEIFEVAGLIDMASLVADSFGISLKHGQILGGSVINLLRHHVELLAPKFPNTPISPLPPCSQLLTTPENSANLPASTTSNRPSFTMTPLPSRTLGQLIREKRSEAGLSLRALGDQLRETATSAPVSAAFLSDIESGRRFPSDEMIGRIAAVLGCEAVELRMADPRAPALEIQDLATMNPRYAFAFRRVVDFLTLSQMSPEEFVRRIEVGVVAPDEMPTPQDHTFDELRQLAEAQQRQAPSTPARRGNRRQVH